MIQSFLRSGNPMMTCLRGVSNRPMFNCRRYYSDSKTSEQGKLIELMKGMQSNLDNMNARMTNLEKSSNVTLHACKKIVEIEVDKEKPSKIINHKVVDLEGKEYYADRFVSVVYREGNNSFLSPSPYLMTFVYQEPFFDGIFPGISDDGIIRADRFSRLVDCPMKNKTQIRDTLEIYIKECSRLNQVYFITDDEGAAIKKGTSGDIWIRGRSFDINRIAQLECRECNIDSKFPFEVEMRYSYKDSILKIGGKFLPYKATWGWERYKFPCKDAESTKKLINDIKTLIQNSD